MKPLPDTPEALVLRTDFSDDAIWGEICKASSAPSPDDGFLANLTFVDDPAFEAVAVAELLSAATASRQYRTFMFVVDRVTIRDAVHPLLVIDLADQPGRTFRVIPSEMWSVENNLSLANLDFDDFANAVDEDGTYRGFA